METNMSLLEKDKIMIQHRTTEHQRKAEQEAEKRRNLENEGEYSVSHSSVYFKKKKEAMKLCSESPSEQTYYRQYYRSDYTDTLR